MANFVLVTWAEIQLPSPETAVGGALAVTLPGPSLAAAATIPGNGALAVTVPAPTLAAAGVVPGNGALAVTLPAMTYLVTATATRRAQVTWAEMQLPAGTGGATGTGGVTIPAPSAALAGAVAVQGALAVTLPAPTAGAQGGPLASARALRVTWAELQVETGLPSVSGTLVATLPPVSVALDGAGRARRAVFTWLELSAPDLSGAVAVVLPAPSFAGAPAAPLLIPPLTFSGIGTVSVQAAASAALPALTFTAAGIASGHGTLDAEIPALSMVLTGSVPATGDLAVTLPGLAFRGSAFRLQRISVTISVGLPTVLVTIVHPEASMADPILLYPGNTQPWTFRLTNRDSGDPLPGATIHAELLSRSGDVVIADADFNISDNGDGDYTPALSDAVRDRVLADRTYRLHVFGNVAGVDFNTTNEVKGSLLAAATVTS